MVSTPFSTIFQMIDVDQTDEKCAVDLRVRLPRALADEAEEVQRRDPEALSRILVYGLTRRTIYRRLSEQRRDAGA